MTLIPNKLDKFQKGFLNSLSKYMNGGCFSKKDFLISVVSSQTLLKKNAAKIIREFNDLSACGFECSVFNFEIEIEPYYGKNYYVLKMMKYLSANLKNDLFGAYVHGSLGMQDEIAYSDFDALVIVKNEAFYEPQRIVDVAKKLNSARSIMFEFDPLQHHGWFVLTEYDLKHFPRYYFPLELFKYSKSLLNGASKLQIRYCRNALGNIDDFQRLADSIIYRNSSKRYPKNMYQLKSLLSQFMLLPALYIQAKYNREIYKKYSFEEARKDFSEDEWKIMDEVSFIRSNWNYTLPSYKRKIMSFPDNLVRYYTKNFAPKIPREIYEKLTSRFYERMLRLILSMLEKLKKES